MNNTSLSQINQHPELRIKSGKDFELDAVERFFPDDLYKILNRQTDFKSDNNSLIQDTVHPGFQFEIRDFNLNIWVESKFCENKNDADYINVFNPEKLKWYQSFKNSFLLLCTTIQHEQWVYLIPFNHILEVSMTITFLEPYRLKYGPPVRPGMIGKYLKYANL